jgi:hypothetical protein
MDLGRLFPVGPQWGPDGNLKAGGKGLDQYLWPFGGNVDANGNIKPRGSNKPAQSKPAYSGSRKGAMMGVPNDPGYKTEELEQGQKAENFRTGAGFTGQTPTVSTRDVQKADGSKGTQTSPGGGMPILDAAGAQKFYQSVGLGGFLSTQLPGTGANPDNKGTIEAVPFGGQETSITTNTLGAFSDTNGNAFTNLNPKINPETFTNPNVMKAVGSTFDQYGGMAQGNGADTAATQGTKQPGEKGPSRIMEALNDTDGINSYMSKFGSPEQDRMRAANMAFLSTEGPGSSLLGLRAKEAVLGQIHAGGQTYQLNEDRTELIQNEDGKPKAANRDAASAFRQGTMGAEEYRESFKDQVKKVASDAETPTATPKAAENMFARMPAEVVEFPTNVPAGTFAPGTTEVGEMIDNVKAMDMTPPMSSQQISNSFLNQREPLMRDPRK